MIKAIPGNQVQFSLIFKQYNIQYVIMDIHIYTYIDICMYDFVVLCIVSSVSSIVIHCYIYNIGAINRYQQISKTLKALNKFRIIESFMCFSLCFSQHLSTNSANFCRTELLSQLLAWNHHRSQKQRLWAVDVEVEPR